VILYFSVEAPHRWIVVDRKNRILEDGLADSLESVPGRHRRVVRRVGVVPGELVTIHSLRIPARSRSKAMAAVPYMLEESLASNVEDLEFRLLRWVRGGVSKVGVMSSDVVEHWHNRLLEVPERTDALIPDYLLLPRHAQSRCTVAVDEQGRLVVRTGDYDGMVIGGQELDLWWEEMNDPGLPVAVNDSECARHLVERGGIMVNEWRIGTNFTEWLYHGHQVPENVDLLQRGPDSAEQEVARTWMKAAGILLALAVLARVGIDGYDYVTLRAKESQLDREIAATLTETFPDITRIVEPRTQMEQRLAELSGRALDGGFLALLSVVAEAIPAARATVEEITFRDTTLLVTCRTSDFEALDRLQQKLAEDERVVVELVSSGSRDDSISGRFRLDLRTG
jgi:general secretion pathway protein L